MQATLVVDSKCTCGEGPIWHPDEARLYYVDIDSGRLYCYDPVSGACDVVFHGDPIGGFTLQEDGSLLLFQARGAIRHWRDGTLATLVEEIPDERETRFNDVAADPAGRVFCGTMPTMNRPGRLYRLDRNGTLSIVLEGIGCSNGIGFAPDHASMYYTDSAARQIYAFDYDQRSGAISSRRVFVTIDEGDAVPDGMTVDAEGYVWSALWDGGAVVRFAPDGTEDRRIPISCRKASSVIFGGPAFEDTFITSAGGAGDPEAEGPGAGGLFHVRTGVRGVAELRSRIAG